MNFFFQMHFSITSLKRIKLKTISYNIQTRSLMRTNLFRYFFKLKIELLKEYIFSFAYWSKLNTWKNDPFSTALNVDFDLVQIPRPWFSSRVIILNLLQFQHSKLLLIILLSLKKIVVYLLFIDITIDYKYYMYNQWYNIESTQAGVIYHGQFLKKKFYSSRMGKRMSTLSFLGLFFLLSVYNIPNYQYAC